MASKHNGQFSLVTSKLSTCDKDQHMYKTIGIVSLSVFGSNFVLAKVRLGLISVRCSELRGVRFSEVRNVLVLW